MRQLSLLPSAPQGAPDPVRTARLTRHLKARLEDFGPGGPEVLSADEAHGLVCARFPGHDTAQVLRRLASECGVQAAQEGECAQFYLSPLVRFEDLDYLWGCLFEILG